MITFVVTYRTVKGQQATARVAAFDDAGARARFRHEHPGLSIIGVRRG